MSAEMPMRLAQTGGSYRGNGRWNEISLHQPFIHSSRFNQEILRKDGIVRVHISSPHTWFGGCVVIGRQDVVHKARLGHVGVVEVRRSKLTVVGFVHTNKALGRRIIDVTSCNV